MDANKLIGTNFKSGKNTFQIIGVSDLSGYKKICETLDQTKKDRFYYHASKVLKSGKLSKSQGGTFLRFYETGAMISAM